MQIRPRISAFRKAVQNKFNVYNSLFLSLPFLNIRNTGVLIPLLQSDCRDGLKAGREPVEILDSFFAARPEINSEKEKIDFMFRVIQYVERQVVLFDSVEDAAFATLRDADEQISLEEYIRHSQNNSDAETLLTALSHFRTRIVFTAHPTQFYPASVLRIIAKLRHLISKDDISGIDLALQQLGLTSLLNSARPTPLEEARNIIYFMRNVYYDAVGDLYRDIKVASGDDNFSNTRIIQLGFWPGGDRDGNPFVTSETTLAVANELRLTLMKCYYRDLKDLEGKLTFRRIDASLTSLTATVYAAMFDPSISLNAEQIIESLLEIREELTANFNSLYLEDLDTLIDKVRIFKTHFGSIDIRQNHRVHRQVVTEILKQNGVVRESLDELDSPALLDVLLTDRLSIDEHAFDDELVRDTIRTIRQIAVIQENNGTEGCYRYVISNAEDLYAVLFVFALYRWCCGNEEEELQPGGQFNIPIDIIPLFESVNAMANGAGIMQSLFDLPSYRAHLQTRGNTQTIMLGFSDGTKDGGYLQANWSIHKTKEELSAVCSASGINAVFFDGRGGPPARGGGKTHRFYASQSGRISNHAIELTIQGQVITSMFGTTGHFQQQCEQLIKAGIVNNVASATAGTTSSNIISDDSRVLLDELSRLSFEKYSALKSHPQFIPYLEKKSTLQYYSRANIGSRPSRRGNQEELDLDDLRAIPFVGSWSQLKQNVPGYFGIGTALKHFADAGRLGELQALFQDVPFFKTLVLNSMMSLSKCNFGLTNYINDDAEFGSFWRLLLAEYELSKAMVLEISGYAELMEEEPVARRSIAIREEIVVPLLMIQQYALQKIELNTDRKATFEKLVTRSLYGNINASRNSA